MKIISCSLLSVFLLLGNEICSQPVNPYEVGTWQGFRTSAVSYTFDDNCSNQLAVAVPMFNDSGFTLTLFTVINWGPNWTGLKNAALKGHEIASHTMSHTSFSTLNDDQQKNELKNSQDNINTNVTGQQCLTIAYPNCVTGNKRLCAQYYLAARGCQGFVEPETPGDFMNISSIVCGTQGSVKTAQDFAAQVNRAAASKGWCVFLLHGIDGDGGYSPTQSSEIRTHMGYMKANPGKFWVATFGNVARYIKERNSVSITETDRQTNRITVQITDTLSNNAVYNYPLTIRRPLPGNWQAATVSQNGVALSAQVVTVNSIPYIMFDAVPDGGDVVISSGTNTVTGVHHPDNQPVSFQIYPNPFRTSATVDFSLTEQSEVKLTLTDRAGHMVKEIASGTFPAGNHKIKIEASGLADGMYSCVWQAAGIAGTKKLLLIK